MRQSGFTLLEMVFVIMIVSILSSVAIPKVADTSSAARVAVMKHTAKSIRSSAEYTRGLYLMNRESENVLSVVDAKIYVIRGYPVPASIAVAAGLESEDFFVKVKEHKAVIFPVGIPHDQDCSILYHGPASNGFITKPPKVELRTKSC